jgi:uncharacterized protein (DUF2147 family)
MMIRNIIVMMIFLFLPFYSLAETSKSYDSLTTGLWISQKGDVAVRMDICGKKLCGHVAWLKDKKEQYGAKGDPLCHEQVLYGFKPDGKKQNVWRGGKIYKADDDETYPAILTLSDDETLKLRAYLGLPVFGKTKILKHVDAENYPECVEPPENNKNLNAIAPASGS